MVAHCHPSSLVSKVSRPPDLCWLGRLLVWGRDVSPSGKNRRKDCKEEGPLSGLEWQEAAGCSASAALPGNLTEEGMGAQRGQEAGPERASPKSGAKYHPRSPSQ